MGKWIFVILGIAIGSALFAYFVPRLAAIGLVVLALSLVALLQAVLTAIAVVFSKTSVETTESAPEHEDSELSRLIWSYRNFKLFLARLTGILGFVYGIAAHSLYFTLLGAGAPFLFWLLDHLQDSRISDLQSGVDQPTSIEDSTFERTNDGR